MYLYVLYGFVCCSSTEAMLWSAPPHVIILLLKFRSSCGFPFPREGRGAGAAHLCLECGAASLEWGWRGLRAAPAIPGALQLAGNILRDTSDGAMGVSIAEHWPQTSVPGG